MAVLLIRYNTVFKFIFWCALATGSFGVFDVAKAADVVLSPSTGSYSQNQTFTLTVQADPKGDSINAVEAQMSFDTSKLSVVSVSKTGSIFSLWTTEPTFSNSAGTVSFGGGSPTPFSNRSTLVSITFRASGEGSAAVDFDSVSALAADGRGTDVLEASPSGNYSITAGTPIPPESPTETPATPPPTGTTNDDNNAAIAFGDPPRAPEVGSQVFLDPDQWYNDVNGFFTWDLPFDVNAVAIIISTSSLAEPSEIFDPPIDEYEVSRRNLIDGIQYINVQFKNQVGWGATTSRLIKIDTVAPEPFDIKVQPSNSQNGFPLLVFEAVDSISGVDHYQLFIADREPIDITPDEAKLGYLLGELEDGTYTAKVVAYDMAGNTREGSSPVLITAGWSMPVEGEEDGGWWSIFSAGNLFLVFLLIVIAGQTGYIFYERKQRTKIEEKLRHETREIQDQMEKIFSALRDEIYDQVNEITKRPRLSKKEKQAVEGLNQALEVSETLIEKEISDVQKILK